MTDESKQPPGRTAGNAPDLATTLADEMDARLARADAELLTGFPGEQPGRQPVHTVYVPADRFRSDLARQWGRAALAAVDDHATLFNEVARDPLVVQLIRDKLACEPIEDVRIDFEDGYTRRGDEAEDADVLTAAAELARAVASGWAPPYRGIRFKSLEAPSRRRGIRTLTMFLSHFLDMGGTLDDFVVTLPKITSVAQVEAMVELTSRLEQSFGLAGRSVRFELQIETPQSILGPHGEALVAQMIHAGDARVTSLHYGTYDYSAYCGIPPAFQSMEHPVADHAKLVPANPTLRLGDPMTDITQRFGAAPDAGSRAELVAAIDRLTAVLWPHLDREETELMPRVSATLSAAEWHEFEKSAEPPSATRVLAEYLNWSLEDLDPVRRHKVLKALPAPIGLVSTRVFGRGYRRRAAVRWGTAVTAGNAGPKGDGMNKAMKRALRAVNTTAVWLYRRSGGRIGGTAKGVDVLLLTIAGRKTGKPFTVPVVYFKDDAGYVIAGSAGGMKHDPQWVHNLRAAGKAEVEIGREVMAVHGHVTGGAERDRLWHDVVLAHAPFFTKYEQKSGRVIPVATLTPRA